jgi:hypothetical protein
MLAVAAIKSYPIVLGTHVNVAPTVFIAVFVKNPAEFYPDKLRTDRQTNRLIILGIVCLGFLGALFLGCCGGGVFGGLQATLGRSLFVNFS